MKNSTGVDLTFASTLIGHHAMTMNLLEKGGISENGKIIIAGSEGARGDVPGINLPSLDDVAKTDFKGNDIYVGDTILRPSGQSGVVIYYQDRSTETDQWIVN